MRLLLTHSVVLTWETGQVKVLWFLQVLSRRDSQTSQRATALPSEKNIVKVPTNWIPMIGYTVPRKKIIKCKKHSQEKIWSAFCRSRISEAPCYNIMDDFFFNSVPHAQIALSLPVWWSCWWCRFWRGSRAWCPRWRGGAATSTYARKTVYWN